MPRGKEKLPDNSYVDILSYILETNEYPAASSELTQDAAGTFAFVGKNGPDQVPKFSLIQIVGCLTQHEDGIWWLTRSSDPVRIRMGNEGRATPEELKEASTRVMGNQAFRLVYPDFEPGFDVNSYKGHKMEGKGYFLINPVDQRLSVTWMAPVGDSCDP